MFDGVLNMPWDLNLPGSEYASFSKYFSVLNILFPKYKKVPLCQGSEYTFPEIQESPVS